MTSQEFFKLEIDENGYFIASSQGYNTPISSSGVDLSNWNYITVTYEVYDYTDSYIHIFIGQTKVSEEKVLSSPFGFDQTPQYLHIGSNPTFL